MPRVSKVRFLLVAIPILCVLYWLNRYLQLGPHFNATNRTRFVDEALTPDVSSSIQSPLLPNDYAAAFPRQVWQTSSDEGKQKYASQIQTWKDLAGFDYHWLSDAEADEFVHETFSATRPSLVAFWDDLSATDDLQSTIGAWYDERRSSTIVLRADLLRYMLMFADGGVYADIDTSVLLHVDQWIPEHIKAKTVNAVIGIEYDDASKHMFVRPISFCQWTLFAKPGHPIFERAINRVVSNLEFIARKLRLQSLSQLKLDMIDVLEATGPGMISDVVLEVLRDQLPDQNISWASFHDQRQPELFGDVLILPINGFAGNQKHSHAGHPMYGEILVKHHFGRSWYRESKA